MSNLRHTYFKTQKTNKDLLHFETYERNLENMKFKKLEMKFSTETKFLRRSVDQLYETEPYKPL